MGRLLDHVHLRVSDLEASKRFYAAALEALGLGPLDEGPATSSSTSSSSPPTARRPRTCTSRSRRPTARRSTRFHAAALAAGGRDNGAPGERHYHPGYYAAFVLDPDGNNIEAVNHGPATALGGGREIRPA